MRKSLFTISAAALLIAVCTSSITNTKKVHKLTRVTYTDGSTLGGGGFSQTGCTAASGCHGTKASTLTTGVISGLPANNIVTAGATYTLSVVITDIAKTPTQKNWGFDMASTGGLFTSTNTNVMIEPFSTDFGTEAHHGTTPPKHTATAAAPSYTFDKIVWTAPLTPGKDTFTYACNAANNDGAATTKDHPMLGTPIVLTVNPSSTPVTLASFDATLSANTVAISWTTATETNTDHFEIERSFDGKTFAKVGTQKASGTTSSSLSYTYKDNASSLSGLVYYRLKSIDKSGVFNYSGIKTVTIKAAKNLITSLYPNPLKSGQTIKVNYASLKAGNVSFDLVNTLGRKVLSSNQAVTVGNNNISLSVAHLTSGVYYLSVNDGTNSLVQKETIVIQ